MIKDILQVNESTLGYLESLPAMLAAKAEKQLCKVKNYNGEIAMAKDMILSEILSGAKIEADDKKYYIGKSGEGFYIINKTEYNFAEYLLNSGFDNEYTLDGFIEMERRIRKEKEHQAELEEQKRAEEYRKMREKEEEFKQWFSGKVETFNNEKYKSVCKAILKSEFTDMNNVNKKGFAELLVAIENADNLFCKQMLKERLHTDNKVSRKVYEHCTGLKLPKTNKETYVFLDRIETADYEGVKELKARKKSENSEQIFYILRVNNGEEKPDFMAVKAKPYNKYGLNLFIRNNGGRWSISSVGCGMMITSGKTRKEAEAKLKDFIDKNGVDKIKEAEYSCGEKYGFSPLSYKD